ncbi:MAG: hypothetical protein ACYDA1_02275 [Vulcanimicrobiaceae bacterium]
MIRYYVFATVFVLCVAVLGTAWWHRDWFVVKLASVRSTAPPPGLSSRNDEGVRLERPFIATASWALSAVPECLLQHSEVRGDVTYVRAHLPAVAPLPVGRTIRIADCVISVENDGIDLARGPDRMHISAPASLYRQGQRLWLYVQTQGVPLLRSYDARAPIL